MSHKPLSQNERYQIQALANSGMKSGEIAMQLKRHRTTIERELSRGLAQVGQPYQADIAQGRAGQRATGSRNARRISTQQHLLINSLIRLGLSPEQVSGRLRAEQTSSACCESIYQHIYRDKAAGGDLVSYLRCQKVRRKRYGSGHDRRGQLKKPHRHRTPPRLGRAAPEAR